MPADSSTPTDYRTIDDPAALEAELERLASELTAASNARASNARASNAESAGELAGLIPCESDGEAVAIAARQLSSGFDYSLVRMDTSEITDTNRIREAFVLVAMTEAVRELIDIDALREIDDRLTGFAVMARKSGLDATDAVTAIAATARVTVAQLLEIGNRDLLMPATARNLDLMGTQLRELEAMWKRLEQQLDIVADRIYAQRSDIVEALWATLAAGRRNLLLTSVADVIEQGRRAGMALGDEVIAAQPADRAAGS